MIPTAEEFLDLQHEIVPSTRFDIRQVLIEFARMHVKAALEEVLINIEISGDGFLNEGSILDAYPESNIK